MNPQDVARTFWQRGSTPKHWMDSDRLSCNLSWIASRAGLKPTSLIDIGCGDGSVTRTACGLFAGTLERIEVRDINPGYVEGNVASLRHAHPAAQVAGTVGALDAGMEIVRHDLCLLLGVLIYIMDDEAVLAGLARLKPKRLIIRVPCTGRAEDEAICKWSEDLKSEYAAIYRTLGNTLRLIERDFVIHEVGRAYPDAIESRFGTKQYFISCEPRSQS